MIPISELKSLIPHGKYKEIAVKAGVSSPAVTNFFNGKTKSSYRIRKAALEVALENTTEIKELETRLKKVS
jgi:DNA-binding MurR/RpiR family transcriptional regulator